MDTNAFSVHCAWCMVHVRRSGERRGDVRAKRVDTPPINVIYAYSEEDIVCPGGYHRSERVASRAVGAWLGLEPSSAMVSTE